MKLYFLLSFLLIASALPAQTPHDDELLRIAQEELTREWDQYRKLSQPPYFISYRINDIHSAAVASSFGSLVHSNQDHNRLLLVDVRVGDYKFDSSHPESGGNDAVFEQMAYQDRMGSTLPLDNKKEPIQLELWENTENAYRSSLEMYKNLKNSVSTSKTTKPVDDFSQEEVVVHVDAPIAAFETLFDKKEWEGRIKKYTARFLANQNIVTSYASLEVETERKYFISTEGSRVVQNRVVASLSISAAVRADDGDIIPLHLSYLAYLPKELPSDNVIERDIEIMAAKLEKLRTAPIAEPYTGPAILHARAAGVFFHEIFGHRVEGHRLKNEFDGQTFKNKVNEQVLPKTLSVVFDPTLTHFNGQALNGSYLFDDEGVKAEKVTVVQDGVLKTFLMSRTPIDGFSKSNGHGRSESGAYPVSRQSNLIIQNKKEVQMSDLRKMLINECKRDKKPYGYLFMDVIGGFTTTDRFMPNAFNIFPTEVYRVYVDGRPDELVRGVDLIGTPLAMFAGITAADDRSEIFTGFCGAESGSVPVTAISPSLFVKRIETQRKAAMKSETTLLPRPQEGVKTSVQH